MNNRNRRSKLFDHLYKIQQGEYCVYCGMFATGYDHFVPLWYLEVSGEIEVSLPRRLMKKLPCCIECNSIAGAMFFRSIGTKRRYIQKMLHKKYRQVLTLPNWKENEIEELGHLVKTAVLNGMQQKQKVFSRITWSNSAKAIRQKFVEFKT